MTLKSLKFVSKDFFVMASLYTNRHRTFNFKDGDGDKSVDNTQEVVRALLEDADRKQERDSIRFITIVSVRAIVEYSTTGTGRRWLPMSQLLAKIPDVRSLTFRGYDQMPVLLLETLQKYHPKAHLHVHDWTRIRPDEDHNNPAEIALARSPNLRSIQGRIAGDGGLLDLRLVAFKRIIHLAPNLETVDIFGGQPPPRSLVSGSRGKKKLQLFYPQPPKGNAIKVLISRWGNHLAALRDVTDISMLERIDVGVIKSQDLLNGKSHFHCSFPNLRHLSVWLGSDSRMTILRFLEHCNPLESLSLTNRCGKVPISSILDCHGSSLRTLALHETEEPERNVPGDRVSVDDLEMIGRCCPQLVDLAMDIDYSQIEDPEPTIWLALARLPRLVTLRIYIGIGSTCHRELQCLIGFLGSNTTLINQGMDKGLQSSFINSPRQEDGLRIENIWSILRHEKRVNNTTPLQELHIKVGEIRDFC